MKTKISAASLCLLILLNLCSCSSNRHTQNQSASQRLTKHPFYLVVIDGVECGTCEQECISKISQHKLIKSCELVHRDYENSRIVLAMKKHGRLSQESLRTIINNTGFTCVNIEESDLSKTGECDDAIISLN